MEQSSNGNLIILGSTKTDTTGEYKGSKYAKWKLYIFQIDKDFKNYGDFEFIEWDRESTSSLIQLLFLNENEFIVIGYKDNSKLYVSKILWNNLSFVNDWNKNNKIFNVPTIVKDFLVLNSMGLEGQKIEIYSILGYKVIETEFRNLIDIKNLSAGVYTIKIGNLFAKFIKI